MKTLHKRAWRMKNPETETFFGGRGGRHRGARGGPMHGGHEGRGPGGRRRRQFDSDALRLLVIGLIAEKPRHGYDLIRGFEERSGGAYAPSPGLIYPLLTMLTEMGLIEEAVGEGARKNFAITDAGTAELESRRAEYDAYLAKIDRLAQDSARVDPTPVRRAMQNLKAALMDRLSRGDMNDETVFAAVALIDGAARDIERL